MADRVYLGGVTNTTLHLEADGTVHVEEKQDAANILDFAAAGRNNRYDADVAGGMMRHVAEVPMVEYIKWCREAGVEMFTPAADIVLELKLRDPAYAKLLAAPTVSDPHIIMRGSK